MMGKSPDVQFEIQFLVWNVESMSRKWGEISETLKRQCVDICELQRLMLKRQEVKMIAKGFKFLSGVGVVK